MRDDCLGAWAILSTGLKITVERPLRLSFQASPERIARPEDEKGFQALAQSKKKGAAAAKEQSEGRELQEAIRKLVRALGDTRARTGCCREVGRTLAASPSSQGDSFGSLRAR